MLSTPKSWSDFLFWPWRSITQDRSERRYDSPEIEWNHPILWNESYKAPRRPRVAVAVDVFEDWQGPMLDSDGNRMQHPEGSYTAVYGDGPRVTMQDIRNRLFDLIDRTPNLDWILPTQHPENVARMWPPAVTYMPKIAELAKQGISPFYRENVWLLYQARTQSELARGTWSMIGLQKHCPVRGCLLDPMAGPITFQEIDPSEHLPWCKTDGIPQRVHPFTQCLESGQFNWVVIGGGQGLDRGNYEPFDLAWAWILRDECRAAGTAFYVENIGSITIDSSISQDAILLGLRSETGSDPSEWPGGLQGCRNFPQAKEPV